VDQKVEALSPDDLARVEAQRKWVRDHYPKDSLQQYDSVEGKLRVLDAILQINWVQSSETVKLQSLGIALGDALAQELGLTWVAVEDEYGRDPALILKGTSVRLFPLTMISKRVERGEAVDIYDLFSGTCGTVRRLRDQGA
jgi:hypothetical protein